MQVSHLSKFIRSVCALFRARTLLRSILPRVFTNDSEQHVRSQFSDKISSKSFNVQCAMCMLCISHSLWLKCVGLPENINQLAQEFSYQRILLHCHFFIHFHLLCSAFVVIAVVVVFVFSFLHTHSLSVVLLSEYRSIVLYLIFSHITK